MMRNKAIRFLLKAALLSAVVGTAYRYGATWLRLSLLYLSTAEWARRLVSDFTLAWRVARRFVAGEDISDALAVTQTLNEKGLSVTLDYLGESVTSVQDTFDARDQILNLLDQIHALRANANVSVKLSQLGLEIDPNLARENVCHLLERAQQYGNKIRIDMEESALTEQTMQIYRSLRDEHGFGHRVGIVIQAYLYRSEDDIRQLVSDGAWVRLCKGAYAEPAEIAFPRKADTDANFLRLMRLLLGEEARNRGVCGAIATHDEEIIRATVDYVQSESISAGEFEFQMLYGIRRDLQESLAAQGYQVRVYVPFGTAWYPYFVRRLAEHPANLWFFISNFFRN